MISGLLRTAPLVPSAIMVRSVLATLTFMPALSPSVRGLDRLIASVVVSVLLAGCGSTPSAPGTERVLWRVEGRGSHVTPSVDATTVYFGSIDHELLAIEQSSGAVRWRRNTGVTSAWTEGFNTVVAGDIVAMGDIDVYAYDRRTGQPAWVFRAADDDETGTNTLVSDGVTLFAPSFNNRMYAIDAGTGAQRWLTQLPGDNQSSSFNPTLRDGYVYVGIKRFGIPTTGALAALDAMTGAIRWVREFDASYPGALYGCLGRAAFHGANVIAAVEDGRIYALDRVTGATRWIAPRVHPIPPEPGGGYGDKRPLVVVGDIVVAGSDRGIVVGLDAATGLERWRWRQAGSTMAPFTSDGQSAFVRIAGGELIALDASTGVVRWREGAGGMDRGGTFASGAIAVGDRLYVSGFDGYYALRR